MTKAIKLTKTTEYELLTDREEAVLVKRQRKQLKLVRKLLIQQNAEAAMIEAIDQAIIDNDQWG